LGQVIVTTNSFTTDFPPHVSWLDYRPNIKICQSFDIKVLGFELA